MLAADGSLPGSPDLVGMAVSERESSGPGCSLIGPDLGNLSAVKTCAGKVSAAEIGLGPCLGSSGRRATTESAPCRRC
jgi:hypothetical protein